jgi:hypothetical protein
MVSVPMTCLGALLASTLSTQPVRGALDEALPQHRAVGVALGSTTLPHDVSPSLAQGSSLGTTLQLVPRARVADGLPFPPIDRTRVADGGPWPPIDKVTRVADGRDWPPIPNLTAGITRVADGIPWPPIDRARVADGIPWPPIDRARVA